MGYGRLAPSDPGSQTPAQSPLATSPPRQQQEQSGSISKKLVLLTVLSVLLIAASAVSAVFLIGLADRPKNTQPGPRLRNKPTQAISRACGRTRFPNLCVNSLVDFPGALSASETDLVHISFNVTLRRLSGALNSAAEISGAAMDPLSRSAFDACLELMEDSVDALSRALDTVASGSGKSADVMTWLSAALTNQDTCEEGFEGVRGGEAKGRVIGALSDLSELLSNCLALFSGTTNDDFAGVPIGNRRRLFGLGDDSGEFPSWVGRRERRLLALPVSGIQADVVVSKSANGTNGYYASIVQALKKAPSQNSKRFVIYVMAGR